MSNGIVTYTIESRVGDKVIDTIATGLRFPEVQGVLDECEAERKAHPGCIVGKLIVVPVYDIERPYKAQTAQYVDPERGAR